MRVATIFGTTLALIAGIGGVADRGAQAIQLSDGTVYFAQPPDLVEATTTFKGVYMWGATYYFTINVPQNAGEPLQRVTITQREGTDNIRYDLEDSRAFVGTRSNKGSKLTLGSVTQNRETRTVSVTFDPPVDPGQTVTIGLRPVRNPRFSGVYLFGVTAFPAGEKSRGQFLGYGRLHFYDGGIRTTLILLPTNLYLTIHESVRHPTELDRVYGYKANFAGTSFATTDKVGTLQYAAPWVNFRCDRTQPGGRSTLG